jgi:arginyl-tRNA synthetase
MKTIPELIAEELKGAFAAAGFDEKYAMVTRSNRPDLCEFQCNGAMACAKVYKKKPIDIANAVLEQAKDSTMFSEISAVMPGFINIRLNPVWLAGHIQKISEDKKFGLNEAAYPETIIVDFGGANVAKPLHVGHLRSAVIGESVQRLARYMGHKVISDVHLGDWGLQMGLIITELQERKPDLVYFDQDYSGDFPEEAPFTISELEDIYPAASKKSKEDEAFAERAHQATLKLQQGYAPYRALWRHIMNVSLKDLKKNYDNLNVHFDLWKGESDADPYIPALIQDFIDKGLAYESNGALVVDIAEEGDSREYPPCIIRKSDGAALYATSDLATSIPSASIAAAVSSANCSMPLSPSRSSRRSKT